MTEKTEREKKRHREREIGERGRRKRISRNNYQEIKEEIILKEIK